MIQLTSLRPGATPADERARRPDAAPARRAARPASLRLRLVVWPAVVLLATLAATVGLTLRAAPDRIDAEVRSSMRLGERFAAVAIEHVAASPDPGAALDRLAYDLPEMRHVRFVLGPPPGDRLRGGVHLALWRGASEVPAWFARLVEPAPLVERFPIVAGGRAHGELLMVANPMDEIAEVWRDLSFLAGLLAALAVVVTAVMLLAVGRALRPVRQLADGLDELELGHFDHAVPPVRVAELARIGERFNSLARRLRRATDDNHHLIDRLMSLQEAERKELARELHDELGPCLFGIRADVACIDRMTRRDGPAWPGEVRERAASIGGIVDSIQAVNRRLLASLRPMALDHIGLVEALEQLVATWRERHPAVEWLADLPGENLVADEAAGLDLYRIAQECLTNAARHAGAARVRLVVEHRDAGAALRLAVEDDGVGPPPGFRYGFGLLGMAERVRRLGGRLAVEGRAGRGTRVEVVVPLGARAGGER